MRTHCAQVSAPAKILLAISCALMLLFATGGAIVWVDIELSMSRGLKGREEMKRAAAVNDSPPIGDPQEGASVRNSGFRVQNDSPRERNRVIATPVSFDSPRGSDLRKVLMAAHKLDSLAAGEFEETTSGGFVFEKNDGVIDSSLTLRPTEVAVANLLRAKDTGVTSDDAHKSTWFRQPPDISGKEVVKICRIRLSVHFS